VEDANQFIEISDEMDRLCQNEWRTAMDDYRIRPEQFQAAMKGRDLQAIKDAFQKFPDCKASCHKKFRQK
jgi:cytochrome c556